MSEKFKYNLFIIKIIITIFLIKAPSTYSGIHIEPYFGYIADGKTEQNTGGNNLQWSFNGPIYGARLGYNIFGFITGIEYAMSAFDHKFDSPESQRAANPDDEFEGTFLGLFIGYDFPVLSRFWLTYFFNAEYEDKDGTNSSDLIKGSSYALGLGYKMLPLISLNVEYRKSIYDKEKDASTGITTNLGSEKYEIQEIIVSLSFPFNL